MAALPNTSDASVSKLYEQEHTRTISDWDIVPSVSDSYVAPTKVKFAENIATATSPQATFDSISQKDATSAYDAVRFAVEAARASQEATSAIAAAKYNKRSAQYSSAMMSEAICSSVAAKTVEQKQVAADMLRERYCQVFDDNDAYHPNNPMWWKEVLIGTSETILTAVTGTDISQMTKSTSGNYAPFTMNVSDNYCNARYIFNPSNTSVILVGMKPGCDVLTTHGSRLHMVIYLFPQINKMFFVDVGSLSGVVTTDRTNADRGLISSTMQHRNTIEMEYGEQASLLLCAVKIHINAATCTLCGRSSFRNKYTTCKHYTLCTVCSEKLDGCPKCIAMKKEADSDVSSVLTEAINKISLEEHKQPVM